MVTKDYILALEQPFRPRIILHNDGIVYWAYEYSAYYFHQYIAPSCQLYKCFYKVVNQDMIYLGFPTLILDRLLEGLTFVQKIPSVTDDLLELRFLSRDTLSSEEFLAFKQSIRYSEPLQHKKRREYRLYEQFNAQTSTPDPSSCAELLERIREFDLKGSTAFEAVAFIRELQDALSYKGGEKDNC